MLENFQNSTCDYSENLVSYLYNEMSDFDKSFFETHLEKCLTCQEELTGFSLARTSINEWREIEFLPLDNPNIEIPYQANVKKVSRGLIASVRDFFTLSPAWITATTAFAALVICLGLFAILVSSFRDKNNVARIENGNNKIVPSPTNGNQIKDSNVSISNQNQQKPNISPELPIIDESQKPVKTVIVQTKAGSAQSVTKTKVTPIKKQSSPKTSDRIDPKPIKTQKQKAPSFIDDDDEVDSLTLTDLLEEIGMREIDDKK